MPIVTTVTISNVMPILTAIYKHKTIIYPFKDVRSLNGSNKIKMAAVSLTAWKFLLFP